MENLSKQSQFPEGASQPIQLVRVLGGENYMGPADAKGRLEQQVYAMQQSVEAHGYEPDSFMGQRFQMAISLRENALQSLGAHKGNYKQAIKGLKTERRQAIKSNDIRTAEMADLEIGLLKRANFGANQEPDMIIQDLEQGRDPEFGERGALRFIGSSIIKSLSGGLLSAASTAPTFSEALRPVFMNPKKSRQTRQSLRQNRINAIRNRHTPLPN